MSVSLEDRVRCDINFYVEVSCRAFGNRFTHAGHPNHFAVAYARRNYNGNFLLAAKYTLATAGFANFFGNFTRPQTHVAEFRARDIAENGALLLANFSLSVTLFASFHFT